MSRTRLLEQLYDIYNRADYSQATAIPEDFVFHPAQQSVHPEPIVGRDAYVAYLAPDMFVRQWAEVKEIEENGDFVLVVTRVGGETVSGARLEQTSYGVWRFDGDEPRELWTFSEREDAERQAGLRG